MLNEKKVFIMNTVKAKHFLSNLMGGTSTHLRQLHLHVSEDMQEPDNGIP